MFVCICRWHVCVRIWRGLYVCICRWACVCVYGGGYMFVCLCRWACVYACVEEGEAYVCVYVYICADAHVLNVAGVCGGWVGCMSVEGARVHGGGGGGENVRVRQRYCLCIDLIDLF